MITELRPHYKPFEYQIAFDFYKQQHQAHWLADEVPLASDLNDWKLKLTEGEKNLIGNILKSFAQTETYVNDYWSTSTRYRTTTRLYRRRSITREVNK